MFVTSMVVVVVVVVIAAVVVTQPDPQCPAHEPENECFHKRSKSNEPLTPNSHGCKAFIMAVNAAE